MGKQLLKDVLKNGKYAKVVAVGRRPVELDESIPQDKLVRLLVYKNNRRLFMGHVCRFKKLLISRIWRLTVKISKMCRK